MWVLYVVDAIMRRPLKYEEDVRPRERTAHLVEAHQVSLFGEHVHKARGMHPGALDCWENTKEY